MKIIFRVTIILILSLSAPAVHADEADDAAYARFVGKYTQCLADKYVNELRKNKDPLKTLAQIRAISEQKCAGSERRLKRSFTRQFDCKGDCPIADEAALLAKESVYFTIKYQFEGEI